MAFEQIEGVSVYEIRAGLQEAIDRAYNESRPTMIEILTYRHKGHSVADANADKYRTKEEIKRYMEENDPIDFWKKTLKEEGILTDEQFKEINKEAGEEAEAAADFAIKSPFPDESEIFDDVYWEVDNNTEAGRTGRHFFHK
jgi:pyruvate dehydrogenase E1 component alpha subunit